MALLPAIRASPSPGALPVSPSPSRHHSHGVAQRCRPSAAMRAESLVAAALACTAFRRSDRRVKRVLGLRATSPAPEGQTGRDLKDFKFSMDPDDILGDGSILKSLIREGTDPAVNPVFGDECLVHFVASLPDGKVFNDTKKRDQPFKFMLGAEHVLEGFDEGVATMRKGERAMFKLSPEVAYGSLGARDEKGWQVPPDTPVTFDIELIDIIKVGIEVGDQPRATPEEIARGYGREDVGPGGEECDGRYMWERKGAEVLVTVPVEDDIQSKDIDYDFKERGVFVAARGEILLEGVPGCDLAFEDCYWELDTDASGRRCLFVHLQKKGQLTARWPEKLFKD